MKKGIVLFVLGLVVGAGSAYVALEVLNVGHYRTVLPGRIEPEPPTVCYSCFWEGYEPSLRQQVIDFYQQFETPDPFVKADTSYILWRAGGNPNCDARALYQQAAEQSPDPYRRMQALAALGLSAPECGWDSGAGLSEAAAAARRAGLTQTAELLSQASEKELTPRLEETEIRTSLQVPVGAQTMILGASAIQLEPQMRVGAQVDRTARDWLSFQMRWDLTGQPAPATVLVDYHEGKLLKSLLGAAPVEVYPLAGALAARVGEGWRAADETGAFRFEVLNDKLEYPTSHAAGSLAWIVDTHGFSAVAGQAVERKMQLVVGSADAEGDARAAYHLAQKGIHAVFPGDRFQDLLLGYEGGGVLLGTAPVKHDGQRALLGGQPVRFSLGETFVAQDSRSALPAAYYDAPARYFRRLEKLAGVKVEYVQVDGSNQIERVLARAGQLKATTVGVRVATNYEYDRLREWLRRSPGNRAVLFHSGLYPHAQPLFDEFPRQVTFGDLRPRFE
ncbi:MAG: hypothetical protein ACRD5I_08820 [Candidatus Acidiferrales bacterium]